MEDWSLVVELLESYDQNCREVEREALRQIQSIEVPVFNGLRDQFVFKLVSALVSTVLSKIIMVFTNLMLAISILASNGSLVWQNSYHGTCPVLSRSHRLYQLCL